jgi:regulator of replication initiation timing
LPKKKTHSELEHLRGENKSLRSENRNLKRRLRQLEKKEHLLETTDYEEPEEITVTKLITCDDCGKGHYEEFEIMGKIFGTCNVCGHRKKLHG